MIKFLLATMLILAPATYAQERAASGGTETQMTWSALSNQIKTVDTKFDAVNSRVDQVVVCGRKGMIYAPGATTTPAPDAQGCIESAQAGTPANNITKIVNTLTANSNNVTKIIGCNQSGQVYNGTACVSAPKPTCSLATATGNSSGACPSGYSVTGYWSGMVTVGVGSGGRSNGASTTYCSRVVCN